jgi:hypothetical protein
MAGLLMAAAPWCVMAAQPVGAPAPAPTVAASSAPRPLPVLKGLYVNRFAVQSKTRMQRMIAIADRTEINALVLDMKDEFGLNYASTNPAVARHAGTAGVVRNLKALLDTLKAHRIVPIARMVVFKDSVAARLNPEATIRRPDGTPWRDKQGLVWVNPYAPAIWEYNLAAAEELARLGFEEIQFDYIRFPEPYPSLPKQVFPGQRGTKPELLAEFLRAARVRLAKVGARTTADIFGLVTTVPGALEIGQSWEHLAPAVDVLLPMTYPSHYPRGWNGFARPNAEPYGVQKAAITRARERNAKLGLTGESVRPWLQAFSLGKPDYGPDELRAQIRGIADAGYHGWVLWSPGSKYEPFVSALGAP